MTFTTTQKAARLLIDLGPEVAAPILRYLPEEMLTQLTHEISRAGTVSPEIREALWEEWQSFTEAETTPVVGGIGIAHDLLQRTGVYDADAIVDRVNRALNRSPLLHLGDVNPEDLVAVMQGEHPQTIATVCAHVDPEVAARIITALPDDQQVEVVQRLAALRPANPEVLTQLDQWLSDRLASGEEGTSGAQRGVAVLVEILSQSARQTEHQVLEDFDETDPDLAQTIRDQMFSFEKLAELDDRALQKLLRRIDQRTLARSLKGTPPFLRQRVEHNMSQKAMALLREEMEILGPMHASDVEEAQRSIMAVARALEDAGEIVVPHGTPEAMVY